MRTNRRRFFQSVTQKVAAWGAPLSLLGFRLHPYANPQTVGWRGWITFWGKCVGFVRPNGSIYWWAR